MNIKPLPPDTPIPTRAIVAQSPPTLAEASTAAHAKRNYNRRGDTKADPEELERRYIEVAALLNAYAKPGEIKRLISQRYDIAPRSVEAYIAEARKLMLADVDMTKDEMRALAYGQLTSDLKNVSKDDASPLKKAAVKTEIQKVIINLYGLNQQVLKVAATNQGGEDITPGASGAPSATPTVTVDPRKALADLLSDIVVDGEQETPSPGQ